MKFLVISDIHASASNLQNAIDLFANDVDYLILCGDYLNHGPRNPLPEGWNPQQTAQILNGYKNKIICVRGNCDSEVDQMLLDFPCLNAYTTIFAGERRIFVHHGHLYDRKQLTCWLEKGSLIISGHTHIPVLEEEDGLFYFNPGSISLPKNNFEKSFGLVEVVGKKITVKLCSLENNGKIIKELEI